MNVIDKPTTLVLDRILLASDFSKSAERATVYSEALAKRFASTLTLVNVVDLSLATLSEAAAMGFAVEEMREHSAENLDRAVSDLSMRGLRVTPRTQESHQPAQAIVDLADEMKADLVIVGSEAPSALSKLIEGSTSEAVIRHANCPVMTVGPKAKLPREGSSFRTILFATDLEEDAPRKAAVALAFAQDSDAAIYLCHVVKTRRDHTEERRVYQEFEAELKKLIPDSAYDWCTPHWVVQDGEVAERLLTVAHAIRADLLVMGAKRSHTWFTYLSNGDVQKVIVGAECPVMTICSK